MMTDLLSVLEKIQVHLKHLRSRHYLTRLHLGLPRPVTFSIANGISFNQENYLKHHFIGAEQIEVSIQKILDAISNQ